MQYELTVRREGGGKEVLTFEADGTPAAVRLAVARGYEVIAIRALPSAEASRSSSRRRSLPFSLLQFNQELMALLDAGLTVMESLQTLQRKSNNDSVTALFERISTSLQHGRSFSDSLAEIPQHFPELYVATIRASERSGNLPDALSRYVSYQQQFDVLRKKLITTSIYPCMLLGVGVLVALFLIGYVVPRFSLVYQGAGRQIPWMSATLLDFGLALQTHGVLLVLGGAVLAAAAIILLRKPGVRDRLVDWVFQWPLLKEHVKVFQLARFYRTLALLLGAGIPLSRAIGMTSGLFHSAQLDALQRVRQSVEEGLPFSHALERHGMVTPVALSLLSVGEKSGRMADMLERAARFHDEEFSRWMEWLSRLIEPTLIALLGIVIGGVVVLLYMPIFDLANSLS